MSLIDRAIAASRKRAGHHDPSLARKPSPKVAILTCMDPRLNELLQWLGIKPAEAQQGTSCALSCFRFTFSACARS